MTRRLVGLLSPCDLTTEVKEPDSVFQSNREVWQSYSHRGGVQARSGVEGGGAGWQDCMLIHAWKKKESLQMSRKFRKEASGLDFFLT